MTSRASLLRVGLALTAAATGCGGRDDVPTRVPSPSFTLESEDAAVTLDAGSADTVGFRVIREGGFIGAITLTTTGLPNGVRATFAPASLANGVTRASLILAADTNATRFAEQDISISANGVGVESSSVPVRFRVRVPGVSLSPGSPTIRAGGSGTTNVSVIPLDGFTGAVTLSWAPLAGSTAIPAGVTGTFAPNPVTIAGATNGQAVLTLQVPATVREGAYTGVITATGSGMRTSTALFGLTVTATAPPAP